ncbi:MAG: RraA family protein [Casimicrobiaceae bacterium]
MSPPELAAWREIPAAVASDEMRHQGVLSAIRPLFVSRPFAGQAFTIEVQLEDSVPPREALKHTWPGACIVIDARVTPDAAVWGGNLIRIAQERGVVAVIVDGNVRDVDDLRDSGLAVCSGGVTPRGPTWSGTFGIPIHCGGVEIRPGDLIIGDEDGVVAVPLAAVNDDLLARCRARMARDAKETTS